MALSTAMSSVSNAPNTRSGRTASCSATSPRYPLPSGRKPSGITNVAVGSGTSSVDVACVATGVFVTGAKIALVAVFGKGSGPLVAVLVVWAALSVVAALVGDAPLPRAEEPVPPPGGEDPSAPGPLR